MLEFLRNKKRSILVVIIAVIMVVFMIGFGIDIYNNVARNSQEAPIRVGSKEIEATRFYRELDQLSRMYRAQFGENFERFRSMMNLEQQVVDSIINNELLGEFATELGLGASTKQIEEKVISSPFFAQGFTQEAYRQYLRALGVSGPQLEESMRGELIQEQIVSALNDLGALSVPELRAVYQNQERKYQFFSVVFDPEQFVSQVTVDEKGVEQLYEKRKEEYRAPKKVRFSAVAFRPSDFTSSVPVSEEDVQEIYETRRNEFVEPREFLLKQIVIQRGEKEKEGEEAIQISLNSDESKRKIAEAIVERLKSGEGFEKLARELSEEKETKEKGGELGWRTTPSLSENIRAVVQDLDRGEFSGVVETDEGFFIVQLAEVREPKQKTLAEVRSVIESELRESDAPIYAEQGAERALGEWQGSGVSLREFAAKNNLPVLSSESALAAGDVLGGAPGELTTSALELSAGSREKISLEEGAFLVEVLEVRDSVVPPLSEVRERVVAHYIKERSNELAREAAKKKLEEGRSAAAGMGGSAGSAVLVSLLGDRAEESKLQTRGSADTSPLSDPSVKSVVFSLSPTSPLVDEPIEADGKFYLFQLKTVEAPDEARFEEKKVASSEAQGAGSRLYRSLVQSLRGAVEIRVDPDILKGQG